MKKIVLTLTAVLTGLITQTAVAQYRLPSLHNQQHQSMLAHQRPAAVDLKAAAIKNVIDEIKEREAINDDVFAEYWQSQNVNAYAGAIIPEVKDIDVSDFVAPLKKCNVSSPYGWRARFGRMHRGVDLTLNVGDTVSSAFDGKVRLVKYEANGYGNYIVIRHDNGMETVYGHLSKALVKPNQRVKAGQALALGGNTGRSTGPHLHFETRFMGLAVNPEALIDFQHKVTHKDIFTFSKQTYERSQSYGPKRSSSSLAKSNKATKAKSYSSSKKKSKRKRS